MKRQSVALFISATIIATSLFGGKIYAQEQGVNLNLTQATQTKSSIIYSNSSIGFSLQIPNSWKDKYEINEQGQGITFEHKASKTALKGEGGALFSIVRYDGKMKQDDVVGAGVRQLIMVTEKYSYVLAYPSGVEYVDTTEADYYKMKSDIEAIGKTIKSVSASPIYVISPFLNSEGLTDNFTYTFPDGDGVYTPSDCLLMVNGSFNPNRVIIKNNLSFVPVGVIAKVFGASVDWDGPKNQVTINNNGDSIVMTIGSQKVLVNGKEQIISIAPFINNDLTYVPLRFISETMGKAVGYLPSFKTKNYPNTELLAYNPVVWVDNSPEMNNNGMSKQYVTNWLKWQLSNNKKLFEQDGNNEVFTGADVETTSYIGQVGRYALFKSVYPILVDMANESYYLVNLQNAFGGIYKEDTVKDEIVSNIFNGQGINVNSDNSIVKSKVKIFEGVYFDNAVYGEQPASDTNLEIKISNITDQSFDFSIYKRNIATDKTELILSNKTATFTGDGNQAVFSDESQNTTFNFPDNHLALPFVTDIQVKGNKLLEGKTFVNNNIPGHTFG